MECARCPGLGHGPSPGTGVWAQPHPVTWSASEKGDSPKENQGTIIRKRGLGWQGGKNSSAQNRDNDFLEAPY